MAGKYIKGIAEQRDGNWRARYNTISHHSDLRLERSEVLRNLLEKTLPATGHEAI